MAKRVANLRLKSLKMWKKDKKSKTCQHFKIKKNVSQVLIQTVFLLHITHQRNFRENQKWHKYCIWEKLDHHTELNHLAASLSISCLFHTQFTCFSYFKNNISHSKVFLEFYIIVNCFKSLNTPWESYYIKFPQELSIRL